MVREIRHLGRQGLSILETTGSTGMFLFQSLFGWPRWPMSFVSLIQQLYSVGVLSLVIIVVSALFIGMVLGLQGYTLELFICMPTAGWLLAN